MYQLWLWQKGLTPKQVSLHSWGNTNSLKDWLQTCMFASARTGGDVNEALLGVQPCWQKWLGSAVSLQPYTQVDKATLAAWTFIIYSFSPCNEMVISLVLSVRPRWLNTSVGLNWQLSWLSTKPNLCNSDATCCPSFLAQLLDGSHNPCEGTGSCW